MINVSDNIKYASKQLAQERRAYIDDGVDRIEGDHDIKSLKLRQYSDLCKTLMRYGEAVFSGEHDYLEQYVDVGIGIVTFDIVNQGSVTISIGSPAVVAKASHTKKTGDKFKLSTTGSLPTGLAIDTYYYAIVLGDNTFNIASSLNNAYNDIKITTTGSQSGTHSLISYPNVSNGAVEYINYGKFKVTEQKTEIKTGETTIKFSDLMYDALQKYDILPTYPMTLLQFLQAICDRLGWTLLTTSFPNDDLMILSELFSNQQVTFRDVLDQIAEASASIILFNSDDQLVVKQASLDDNVDSLDQDTLITLEVQEGWGPISTVVLSRQPQEDNIVETE